MNRSIDVVGMIMLRLYTGESERERERGDLKRGATPLGTVPSAEKAQWETERSASLAAALL